MFCQSSGNFFISFSSFPICLFFFLVLIFSYSFEQNASGVSETVVPASLPKSVTSTTESLGNGISSSAQLIGDS